ncbi:MAG: ABC transporter permease [Chloroflexi bacterium]|nr:MAG: ABC transporter permease [Chloroflexota bacterium]
MNIHNSVKSIQKKPIQIVLQPEKGWQPINWRELRDYKDLLFFLVTRDVKVVYKQTIFGFAWAIINPLFSMIIFTIIFGNLVDVSSDGVPYPLFSYVALVPWAYFSSTMNASTLSLVSNASMLTKVYFPRLVFPMTPVFAKLVDFAVASIIIGVLMVWHKTPLSVSILLLPVLTLLMMLTAAGIGMWLSALAIQYRDVKHLMPVVSQILMYAAPVVWPASLISERFGTTARLLYGLYPMAGVIEGFRSAILQTNPMPWDLIGLGSVSALAIAISGAFYFKRMEMIFADVA